MRERKIKRILNGQGIFHKGVAYSNSKEVLEKLSDGFVIRSKMTIKNETYEFCFMSYKKDIYIPVITEIKAYWKMLNGINFSIEELNLMKREIYRRPIAEQAKYADNITQEGANDVNFIFSSMMNLKDKEPSLETNATAIGNLAYLALYAPPLELRENFKKIHSKHQQFGMEMYHS